MTSTKLFKINLLNDPYRIRFNFKNNLIIKENKDHNKFIRSFRLNKISNSYTSLVLEFNTPTIISDIKYNKINNKHIDLDMYLSNTSVTNYAIARHVLNKNNGDIHSLESDVGIYQIMLKVHQKK